MAVSKIRQVEAARNSTVPLRAVLARSSTLGCGRHHAENASAKLKRDQDASSLDGSRGLLGAIHDVSRLDADIEAQSEVIDLGALLRRLRRAGPLALRLR